MPFRDFSFRTLSLSGISQRAAAASPDPTAETGDFGIAITAMRLPVRICEGTNMVRQLSVLLVWLCCYECFFQRASIAASERKAGAPTGVTSSWDAVGPLVVVFSHVDPVEQSVAFALQNTGEKAITAWQVRIVIGNEPEVKRVGFGTDAYRAFSGLIPGDHILPGATVKVTRKVEFDSELITPVAVTTPTAAIFADKSFAGDKAFVERTFQRRAAELKALQQITAELERVRASGGTQQDLELLLFQNPSDNNVMWQAFRFSVSAAVREIQSGRASTASKLKWLMDMAHRNLAAASAHSLQ